MASVLDIAKKLNKVYKNENLAKTADQTPTYQRLATGALGVDFPLYGGLPYGRLVTISGKEHSGKTTGACLFMSAYQRANPDKICVFVDVEHSLDKEFQAQMTGLDLKKTLIVTPEGMAAEDIFDYLMNIQDESDDIGMIILDSIPALVSSKDYEADPSKDNGMAGGIARPLARFIKKMLDTVMAKGNILVLINQVRVVGTTFTGAQIYDEPGGHGPKFYASVKMRFGNRTYTSGDKVDGKDGEASDGFRLVFAITKNKTASTQRGGGFMTFRYETGLDWMFDLMEVALKYEFIQRPNNMTYVLVDLSTGEVYKDEETGEDLKFVGKQKVFDYMKNHVSFQVKYLDMLKNHINANAHSYGSLLDERTLAKLIAEENSTLGERNNEESSEE